MTLMLIIQIALVFLAAVFIVRDYKRKEIKSLRDDNQFQQIYIDALKRQLEAAERIIQRGLYDTETLRRK